ncbi:MAG: UDP-N-acetylmuramoyl-L-alanyl-D-glutamate--2,6-diaminopimelate ligase [Bacilli bacterium]
MNIKEDSRKIVKGDTFIALRKENDGHNYVLEAIKNGAIKVIVEDKQYEVETVIVKDTHQYLVDYLKNNYYDKIKNLKLIAMTGTNGKTTTCFLIYQALNKLNKKCAYIGTIGFYMENKVKDLPNTTPDILAIYEMLLMCVDNNIEYVVMETSSHALDMHRVDTLSFDYALFSNLTIDHLDYHKTIENYALAKQKLFINLKGKAIVNNDDMYKDYFLLDTNKNITYGLSNSDYQLTDYEISLNGSYFKVNKERYHTKLIGKHNLYNILVVITLLKEMGFKNIKDIISSLEAPIGRMDVVPYKSNLIIIDYAHTPDAVLKIINTVKDLKPNNIITIIGCGGNRDKTKRPIMSKIACSLSNHVILTSDNPRGEDPSAILKDMINNIEYNNYEIIENRKKAIIKGIQMLVNNDILLVLGKGHETYQLINNIKYDFNDKKIVIDNI